MIVPFIIYIGYIIYTIYKYDYPKSLSDTYYLYPKWVFPTILTTSALLLLPYWLELTANTNFQFIAFISCAGFIFVGLAPDYKNDKEQYKIHILCAYLIAGTSLLFLTILSNKWYLIPCWLIVSISCDKKFKENYLFHLENSLILGVFSSIF